MGLFLKGLSTKDVVSELSGRGIGLDIVYTNVVNKLKGKIDVETEDNKGTRFTIRFAMNFLIVNALVVRVVNSLFSIPYPNIRKIVSVKKEDLIYEDSELYYNNSIFQYNDIEPFITTIEEKIPVISLQKNYNLYVPTNEDLKSFNSGIIIIWMQEDMKLGILVDEIVTEQQIVYKSMDRLLENIKGFGGYSFIGNGEMVPIIDPLQFIGDD